jgi:hypothetical protein
MQSSIQGLCPAIVGETFTSIYHSILLGQIHPKGDNRSLFVTPNPSNLPRALRHNQFNHPAIITQDVNLTVSHVSRPLPHSFLAHDRPPANQSTEATRSQGYAALKSPVRSITSKTNWHAWPDSRFFPVDSSVR